MKKYARKLLPPMAALHSFSAAARHGSFSRAGDEIGLTQSAVSKQIQLLEEWLGVPLFNRIGRRVTLTAAGATYAETVDVGLDRIRSATAIMMEQNESRDITLATLPSFGMRWLAPRLPRLTAQHPDMIVNFAARSAEFDFAVERFDAAIHFGRPDWPGVMHDLLFREAAIPVCAPALLAEHPVTSAADFLTLPLLVQASRQNAWSIWFRQAGLSGASPATSARFEHFLMLAQAAVSGAGAALIPSFLIEPELQSGALVSPLPQPIIGDEAYYLVYPPERLGNVKFQQLRTWIVEEAAQTVAPLHLLTPSGP